MALSIKDLKAGELLYDVHSERAGNTTMRCEGVWTARVKEVDPDGQWALISWNGNPAHKMYRVPSNYRRHPKEWIRSEIFASAKCYYCNHSKEQGHADDCDHPRAIAARKKAAKGAKS